MSENDEPSRHAAGGSANGRMTPRSRPPSSVSDASRANTQMLLKRARAGSESVWKVFYDRYKEFLIYNIRIKMPSFARRQFDAEDILQTAFLAAWENISSFEYQGEGSFRRYLRRVVLNHFLNQLKHAERAGGRLFAGAELKSGNDQDLRQSEKADPASEYSRKDFLDHALEKLRDMHEDDQELLGMRFFESMTWTDMGTALECDRETAKERFLRALKRLQHSIDQGGAP